MQRFELSRNDAIKLLTREPSLIVRLSNLLPGLPITTLRPIKWKTYQGHTFALRIPLELDDDGHARLKMEHLSWLSLLGEYSQIAPPYTTMGKPHFGISSHVH